MLDAARRRGAELGVTNVGYQVLDAERIELDDDSVDGVLCRLGYMLMGDAATALAETRRVLRPGGRVTLALLGRRNPIRSLRWRGWLSCSGVICRRLSPHPRRASSPWQRGTNVDAPQGRRL
ncbi:MAG TPA: class I SAM-dependent methyltransferase [Actinomycetota bacterium]|nr:class I SAM-dependent methyltransferase [Actinomycetota bacterium]